MQTTRPEISAIIITYNPEIKRLTENISAVLKQFHTVLIVDNGSTNINDIKEALNDQKVDIIELHENKGIAYAQNIGVAYFQEKGDGWVLMLDQDTVIPENAYERMTSLPQFNNEKTGILGMRYLPRDSDQDVHQVTRIIASGNLINIRAWDKVLGFDNQLFIDQVDFDFNYKLQLAGYDIWQIDSLKLNHDVGKMPTHIRYAQILNKLFDLNITEHSVMRNYYIHRNTLIVRKRYPELFEKPNMPKFILKMLILSFSYEKPFKKIKSALKGISDAAKYNVEDDHNFQKFKKSVDK